MRGVAALLLVALLAGCTDPADGRDGDGPTDGPGDGGSDDGSDGGSGGLLPQQGHDEATDAAAPGLRLEGNLTTCDAGLCIEATAHNEGDATYHVSSICAPPWTEWMEKDGQQVAHREPVAYCAAFGTEPFGPGEVRRASFVWNQTVWDGQYAPAQGEYEWFVTFQVYEAADGAGPHRLTISFPVVAGPT